MSDTEFAIVGGGIAGSVLGELLARAGKRVVVLERSAAPPTWTRPELLWPTTARFLAGLLPPSAWEREAATAIEGVDLDDGRTVRTFIGPEVFQAADARLSSTDPNRLREMLLARPTFELRRGVEVVDLLRSGSRVVGVRAREIATGREFEVSARATIADDGALSLVREKLGIPIELRTFALDLVCFGFEWPAGLPASRVRLWANRGGTASGVVALGAVPTPGGRGTAIVPVRWGSIAAGRAADGFERLVGRDPLLAQIAAGLRFPRPGDEGNVKTVRPPFGHAERYGRDGVVLIGDAAHPVSPTGGQGSSMAVADARALAEILIAGAEDPAGELDRRRRRANDRSLALTRVADRVWRIPRWCWPAPLVSGVFALLRSRPESLARAVRDVSTRFQDEPAREHGRAHARSLAGGRPPAGDRPAQTQRT